MFKIKQDEDGSIERVKARLVANGMCSVVKGNYIRIVLTIAITRDWDLKQIDVLNVFLHENIEERIF